LFETHSGVGAVFRVALTLDGLDDDIVFDQIFVHSFLLFQLDLGTRTNFETSETDVGVSRMRDEVVSF
jgi:hypothetical protein